MSRILVTAEDLAAPALDMLTAYDMVYAGAAPDEERLLALCRQHQPVAIIVRYGSISARIMDASKPLKVIAKHGSGTDTIDMAAATARGIVVKAATGVNANAVAEHTWALILACAKSLPTLDARMRAGFWDKPTHKSLELHGKTLGIIGLGAIGSRVAKIGQALGMEVLGHDPAPAHAPDGLVLLTMEAVLQRSDVLTLCCPLTDTNRRIINDATLATMRPGAILVNTARGGLVDEAALLRSLESGKLHAAGLDTFATEPFDGQHPFTRLPNLVLTPHIGGVSREASVNMGTCAAQHVLDALAHK